MRLISLNIALGARLNELVEFVRKESETTDIFAFQEMTDWKKQRFIDAPGDHPGGIETYAAIKKALPDFVPHRSEDYSSIGEFLTIFVKNPLKIENTIDTGLTEQIKLFNLHTLPRILCVSVNTGEKVFWACTTHGALIQDKWREDTPERFLQSRNIIKALSGLKGPKILCGDFNMPPTTKTMGILDKELENLIVKYGVKNTRSASYLKTAEYAHGAEITDHTLVSNGIDVKRFEVPDTEISDHLPMVLEFSV